MSESQEIKFTLEMKRYAIDIGPELIKFIDAHEVWRGNCNMTTNTKGSLGYAVHAIPGVNCCMWEDYSSEPLYGPEDAYFTVEILEGYDTAKILSELGEIISTFITKWKREDEL